MKRFLLALLAVTLFVSPGYCVDLRVVTHG